MPRSLGFAYPHDRGDLSTAAHRCVGVGKCRADTTASGGVMCPSYLATRDEKDSTRGRARVLQELANGSLVRGYRAAELHESLDLCLSCKGCSSDCPAGVDMATYKAEVLHQRYRRRLRPPAHYALGWLPRWARLAARAPRVVNAAAARPPARPAWPSGPAASTRAGRCRASRRAPSAAGSPRTRTPPGTPVLLWVDTFTDHFCPDVGEAAVRVLEDAGYSVRLPDEPGLLRAHLDLHRPARRRPAEAAPHRWTRWTRRCATACRRRASNRRARPCCATTWPDLLPDDARAARGRRHPDARRAAHAPPGWARPGPARRERRGPAALPPARGHGLAARRRAAGDGRRDVDAVGGCCGLAGNFGVERGHYEVSVAVAETALLPAVRSAAPDAVVLADGFSCRTQLEQLAGAHGVHLAELLAEHLDAPEHRGSTRPPVRRRIRPPALPVRAARGDHRDGGRARRRRGGPVHRHAVRPATAAVLAALTAGDTARGYPPSIGTPALRAAAAQWIERRLGARVDAATADRCLRRDEGIRRIAAAVPQLRTPVRDTVLYPAISYPTYEMGATLAGVPRRALRRAGRHHRRRRAPRAVRVGQLAREPHRRAARPGRAAAWGRARDVPWPDECYAEFTWASEPTTILRSGTDGVLAAALAVQARQLRRRAHRLLRRRRRARALPARGPQARRAMPPGPVQAAAVVALDDDEHVEAQRARYLARLHRLVDIFDARWATRPSCPTARSICGSLRPAATRGGRARCRAARRHRRVTR